MRRVFAEGDYSHPPRSMYIILKIRRKSNPMVVTFYYSFKIIRTLEYAYLDQCFLVYSSAKVV